jgi:hypothetical protein
VVTGAAAFGVAMVGYPRRAPRFWAGFAFAATLLAIGMWHALPTSPVDERWAAVGAPAPPVRPRDFSSLPWGWKINWSRLQTP